MNKEEMKNKISMALKDPILQQGFECICKENAELKETLKTYNGCGDWDNGFHTCRVYLQHEELQMYIAQLTTAKELLKWWVSHCGNHDLHYAKKTEQFLKDSGVEK